MDMAQDGMSKKGSSLLEKKDAATEDLIAIRKEGKETNTMMDNMETLVSEELREYLSQNKTTLTSKVKATLMKVGKIMRKVEPRKKRTTLYPILASALKFHKDDDEVDPAFMVDLHAGAEQQRDGENYHESTSYQQLP